VQVARRAPDDTGAEPLEPADVVVEPVVDEPLELGASARALLAEPLEVAIAPDDAAREPHRSAGDVALLEQQDVRAALGRLDRSRETCHPGPCYHEVGHRSDQGEARLVLHVLEPDPLGAPHEDGPGVLGVDDLVDLEPTLTRLDLDLVRLVDEERDVVQ